MLLIRDITIEANMFLLFIRHITIEADIVLSLIRHITIEANIADIDKKEFVDHTRKETH